MSKLTWTLAALVALGGNAFADPQTDDAGAAGTEEVLTVASHGSSRGVAQDYLVLPEGGEISGQMKFVTADPLLGGEPLKFTDLALFGLSGRWALTSRIELSASVELLPKQPSYTDEKPWQSAGGTLRTPIGHHLAVAVSGSGGHLLDHTGLWASEGASVEWKKNIVPQIFDFDLAGGVDGMHIIDHASSAFLSEAAVQGQWLFHEPTGHAGMWVGLTYAVPFLKRGTDPTTGMAIDPQSRMDFRVGGVLAIEKHWDLFAELAFVDRGDLAAPQTRLPILDGGFDQRQIMFGVTRHVFPKKPARSDALQIGRY